MHQRCTTPDVQLPLLFEEWRPVPEWESTHEVSSYGRVRSQRRILKPRILSGRLCVVLTSKGRRDEVMVDRLVLTAFIGPAPFGCRHDYADGNLLNPRLGNLSWKPVGAEPDGPEQWRPVVGFEETHRVSDMGRVLSLQRDVPCGNTRPRTTPERMMKIRQNTCGYSEVHLSRPGKKRTARVHTLVLEAFVGPCPEGMQCRHLNGVRTDARLANLQWGTPLENAADRIAHGTQVHGTAHWCAVVDEEMVKHIRASVSAGEMKVSVARRLGISEGAVAHICHRRAWKHVD